MKQAIRNAKLLKKFGELVVTDVYKLNNLPKVEKGINQYGELVFGYPYSPEYFIKSDVTQRMCRLYIDVDGVIMHPSELDKVKVAKDGAISISKRETVNMTFNNSTERFFSFNKAINEAAFLPVGADTPIELSTSSASLTLNKSEWKAAFDKLVDRRTFTVHLSFQEFCDMQ